MMDYIKEEQATLTGILAKYEFVKNSKQEQIKNIVILATGSSYNACLSAKIALEKLADVTVTIEEPYYFDHYGHLSEAVDTVVAVSQSGKSSSTIDAVDKLTQQGIYTIGITSDPNSPIFHKVNEVIDLEMGIETVGFVTKGYSATVLKLFLLGMSIGKSKGILTDSQLEKYVHQLERNIAKIPQIIEKSEQFFEENKSIFKVANRFISIGYGPNWGTAKEFETKFTETLRKPSQGFELEAYMHGPYLEADNEHVLFFIEAPSENSERSKRLKDYMTPYVGKTFTITTNDTQEVDSLGLDVDCEEWFTSLFLVIPFQIFAHHGAKAKGIDLGKRIFDDFDKVLKSKI